MALIDFLLHFEPDTSDFVAAYGPWVYAILFGIIFVETGVVNLAVSPGRLSLFAAGRCARPGP